MKEATKEITKETTRKPIKRVMKNTKNKKTTVKNYNTDEKINKISDSKSESVKTKKIRKSDTIKSSNTNRRFQRERSKKTNSKSLKSMKVVFLGGLNQIGKNITAFECDNEIIIVDCGMSFPDGEMLGVDLVIPDFSYLEANRDKIKGLVVTHGHEDHIGAIPYLLNKINVPIYATPLTIGLITSKLKENRLLGSTKLTTVMPGETINLGCMNVEFIRVNHSIPDAVGLAIHSPAGTIVHTGDFKIDCTPSRGEMIDLARFAELGKEGVLALMADSTNAERPGYTMTERKLDQSFERLFQKAKNKRIIIATFASNIGRIQQIINCAANYGKKVAFIYLAL